ncbi:ATP-dependent helicase HrpB [Corynebacterium otitidis]
MSANDGVFDLEAIGAGLPVADRLGELSEAVANHAAVVVEAPPGTGKTTLVPPALANAVAAAGAPGRVIAIAPRRVAARAAARRLAKLSGLRLGEEVGFRVRGETRPGSLVEFVTPGVIIRMLLSDPELPGIAAVVADEIHERQLEIDLALALLSELSALRDDFRLVAMSATLDAGAFSRFLGGAPIVAAQAPTFPVETTYAPHPARLGATRRERADFARHLARLAVGEARRRGESALVFVPGVREVEDVVAAVAAEGDIPALPLHGRLGAAEQDAALADPGSPRIVVATSVAESSLTVPGVRIVVDSGLSRVPRREAASGLSGLVTRSSARATSQQRAGRAGREGPGLVIKAFGEEEERRHPENLAPEILTADLTQAALWLACWGTPRARGLRLLDEPPAGALDEAEGTLSRLGAVDEAGAATAAGRRLASLPLHPRLARALIDGGPGAAGTVAALSQGLSGDLARARPEPREARRLARLAERHAGPGWGDSSPGRVVAAAYPERIARLVGEDTYLLAGGARARLSGDVGLSGCEWLAVAEATRQASRQGGASALIHSATRLDEADALEIGGVTEDLEAGVSGGRLKARATRRLGAIELSSRPAEVPPGRARELAADAVRRAGLSLFEPSEKARSLIERLRFLSARLGAPWPDIDAADPEEWLAGPIGELARGKKASGIDVYPAVQGLLPWPEAARLDELAPERLPVPSGGRPRVDYSSGRPVVRVKLQECFGLAASPRIAGRAVQFRLLSPAGRELAITDDLEGFWNGAYPQVRAEMRGRYPKHPWPEDPWSATATARTKKGRR